MSYLSMMNEDEIRYICSVINPQDVVTYFTRYPKDFAKICPGFRPSSAAKLDVGSLLFRNRNRGFISHFVEDCINI